MHVLFTHMSVHDNIAFGLKMSMVPKPEIDRQVADAGFVAETVHVFDAKGQAV